MELTPQRANTLTNLATTLRPEWNPTSFHTKLHAFHASGTFPATNYLHAVEALIEYATARTPDGKPAKLTPAFYGEPGRHWDVTVRRPGPGAVPVGGEPACEDHPEEVGRHCRCCWGDVRAGMREPDQVGKRLTEV